MTVDEAYEIIKKYTSVDIGKFYGAKSDLSLGVGLMYENIRCPWFSIEDQLFSTIESNVYVLTHECDVDQGNNRIFNDFLTIVPMIALEDFLIEHQNAFDDDEKLKNFLVSLAKRDISRVIYFPPIVNFFSYGCIAYLNGVVSTHISAFEDKAKMAALSGYGLRIFDQVVENHWLRPKTENLSFTKH